MDLDAMVSLLAPLLRTGLPGFIGLTVEIENGFLFVYQQLEPYEVRRPKGWDKPQRFVPPVMQEPGETWKRGGEEEEIEMVDVTLHRLGFTVRHCADMETLRAAQEHAQTKRQGILDWDRTRRKERPPGYGEVVAAGY